ncbi:MAG: HAD-IB family hydrolase [Candidatus Harrisonbacteria bacterium CG10_big_fil_rev_8_21_14_0_10_45_28]|uniref:HAD-IB family hydrolase n=1 Tax=Candidatus Harrisonbacteria bacterium CG10_big_fil_rev_8_21_14_0_10_45_28 TaxID=1974586 RepID=A0A2H0UMG0_9BACT|nr:MAG: HAD-IB family hydrolase [Candidatus Harrisonbacteria bacterium CG10_big_fil_rev_8_21_14_0_10_45_28]
MSIVLKPTFACFDIDGTIFRNSLFIELHWKMVRRGLIPRNSIEKLDKAYWNWVKREGCYDDYLAEVVDNFHTYMKGITEQEMRDGVKKVIQAQSKIVYRYTRALIKSLSKTHTLIAISGSPAFIAEEFASFWGFDLVLGTKYEVKDKKYTGEVLDTPVDNKKKALSELIKKHGLKVKDSIAVGDTESDIGMLELVEKPIAFNPTSKLYSEAKKNNWLVVVERKDQVYEIKNNEVN